MSEDSDGSEPEHIALTGEDGKPMTRDAEFDLKLSIGDGMPSDKAFIFDMITDLSNRVVEGKPVIFWSELREYLREEVGMPLKNENEMMQEQNEPQMQGGPQGLPQGLPQGMPPEMPQGMPMQPPQGMTQGFPEGLPPEIMQQLQQLPPELQQQVLQQASQGMGQQMPNNVIPMQGGR